MLDRFHFMFKLIINVCVGLTLFIHSVGADDREKMEKLSVIGQKDTLPTRPGSAHLLSEKELQKFEWTDISQILRSVPGVNIQEEEGFGLRPNIGLRGGDPHRSRKVVLMEDGVLIGPAPYSAPAAYYFPHIAHIESIEVFKGVPSTEFGPNSLGGAINLLTRTAQPGVRGQVGFGSFNQQKYDLELGGELYGDYSLILNHMDTTGFKELEGFDDTGFERSNVSFRWDKFFGKGEQNLTFKLNWSGEISNETYSGLTDEDFQQNPFRRYAGTQLDTMDWNHRQLYFRYAASPTDFMRVRATAYHHSFHRSWDKIIGFGGDNPSNPSPTIQSVVLDPNSSANNFYYQVLAGQADSGVLSDNRDLIALGDNQRQYYSQGLQVYTDFEFDALGEHGLTLGYRFHQDAIDRFHEARFFEMRQSRLFLSDARDQETTLLDRARTDVHTLSLNHEWSLGDWLINPVLRYEDISYDYKRMSGVAEQVDDSEHLFAPGLGVFYQVNSNWGVLAGVNQAYTPIGPGQTEDIQTEEAINYELGMRYNGGFGFELIGFASDYTNLLGTCTQSAGCPIELLDQRFNGGEASVYGAEILLHGALRAGIHNFPIQFSATHSQTQFDNAFSSTNTEWGIGNIEAGDPIPYIPEWQGQIQLGWEHGRMRTYLQVNHLSKMADQALADGRQYIPSRTLAGLSMHFQQSQNLRWIFRVDNLTDEEYAVSRRPFGLRPGLPRSFFLGAQFNMF